MNKLNLSAEAIDRMAMTLRHLAAEEGVTVTERQCLRDAAMVADRIAKRRERPVERTLIVPREEVGC